MNNKIAKTFLIVMLLAIGLILIFIFVTSQNKQSIYISEEKSYFSEFSIVEDEVRFICYVTICNEYDTDKTVLVQGDFSSEVNGGLIVDRILYAVDSNGDPYQYTLQPKEEKSFYVTFVGTFAGTEQMTSRELPPLFIEELK